ncbi:hypothetical protein [Nocardioides sp.]|uniref:hypothetical protein n=1 Tax=Nocardioides sp. TaxID=35761 RepID=UPI003D141E2B
MEPNPHQGPGEPPWLPSGAHGHDHGDRSAEEHGPAPASVGQTLDRAHYRVEAVARERQSAGDPMPPPSTDPHLQPTRDERFGRLREAQRRTAEWAQARIDEDLGGHWPEYLLPTAQYLLDVFTALSQDEDFWAEMIASEFAVSTMTAEESLLVQEIISSDLYGLLEMMDFRPPPPIVDVTVELQLAIDDVRSDPDRARRASRSHDARRGMALFCYRLRPLIEAAERVARTDEDSPRTRETGRKLLRAVRRGGLAAGPAAVAAGVTTVLFPPAAPVAAGAVVAAGMTEAAKELTKRSVEAGSTHLLAASLADEEAVGDPAAVYEATRAAFQQRIGDVIVWARHLEAGVYPLPVAVHATNLEAMRWYFQFRRAELAYPPAMGRGAHLGAGAAWEALVRLREWPERPDPDELSLIRRDLESALSDLVG